MPVDVPGYTTRPSFGRGRLGLGLPPALSQPAFFFMPLATH
jgi:hypothetical protein